MTPNNPLLIFKLNGLSTNPFYNKLFKISKIYTMPRKLNAMHKKPFYIKLKLLFNKLLTPSLGLKEEFKLTMIRLPVYLKLDVLPLKPTLKLLSTTRLLLS